MSVHVREENDDDDDGAAARSFAGAIKPLVVQNMCVEEGTGELQQRMKSERGLTWAITCFLSMILVAMLGTTTTTTTTIDGRGLSWSTGVLTKLLVLGPFVIVICIATALLRWWLDRVAAAATTNRMSHAAARSLCVTVEGSAEEVLGADSSNAVAVGRLIAGGGWRADTISSRGDDDDDDDFEATRGLRLRYTKWEIFGTRPWWHRCVEPVFATLLVLWLLALEFAWTRYPSGVFRAAAGVCAGGGA